MTKEERLAQAYQLFYKYPGQRTAILSKLGDYNITEEEFTTYDSTMTSMSNASELQKREEEFEDIPGFSQTQAMSDTEILRIFETRSELQDRIDAVKDFPVDEDWWKAGVEAEARINKLTPFYDTKMTEEWEQFESGIPLPFFGNVGAAGPMQFLTNLVGGWTDLGYHKKERLHERGFGLPEWVPFIGTKGGSANPLTGFGAWELAEFQRNPEGGTGFSDELLAMENELEELYGVKRNFMSKLQEGGYEEAFPGSDTYQQIQDLNMIIEEQQLIDPRIGNQ